MGFSYEKHALFYLGSGCGKNLIFFINENFGQFLSKQAVYEFFSMKTRFCGFSRNFSPKKWFFMKISFFRLFQIFRPKVEKISSKKITFWAKNFATSHRIEFLSRFFFDFFSWAAIFFFKILFPIFVTVFNSFSSDFDFFSFSMHRRTTIGPSLLEERGGG